MGHISKKVTSMRAVSNQHGRFSKLHLHNRLEVHIRGTAGLQTGCPIGGQQVVSTAMNKLNLQINASIPMEYVKRAMFIYGDQYRFKKR
jgi:hypothetical protein